MRRGSTASSALLIVSSHLRAEQLLVPPTAQLSRARPPSAQRRPPRNRSPLTTRPRSFVSSPQRLLATSRASQRTRKPLELASTVHPDPQEPSSLPEQLVRPLDPSRPSAAVLESPLTEGSSDLQPPTFQPDLDSSAFLAPPCAAASTEPPPALSGRPPSRRPRHRHVVYCRGRRLGYVGRHLGKCVFVVVRRAAGELQGHRHPPRCRFGLAHRRELHLQEEGSAGGAEEVWRSGRRGSSVSEELAGASPSSLLARAARLTATDSLLLLRAQWWTGMIIMILGEVCNLVAYSFVDAILVRPTFLLPRPLRNRLTSRRAGHAHGLPRRRDERCSRPLHPQGEAVDVRLARKRPLVRARPLLSPPLSSPRCSPRSHAHRCPQHTRLRHHRAQRSVRARLGRHPQVQGPLHRARLPHLGRDLPRRGGRHGLLRRAAVRQEEHVRLHRHLLAPRRPLGRLHVRPRRVDPVVHPQLGLWAVEVLVHGESLSSLLLVVLHLSREAVASSPEHACPSAQRALC